MRLLDLWWGFAAARAATGREEPQYRCAERGGGREPGYPKCVGADRDLNIVGVEESVESASQSGEEESDSEGGEQDEQARNLKTISFP